jgi:hypothetical protein
MNSLPTKEFRSTQRPPVQTHVWFIIDAFVEFLLSDLSPQRTHTILTNHYSKPLGSGPFILFNIEQLTRPRILEEVYRRAICADIVEVWDYSEVNANLLRARGIAVHVVPVQTTEARVAALKTLLATQPKQFDIGFCGVAPERRQKILEELSKEGFKLLLLTNTYNPTERDMLLARCRFQVNIHQTDEHQVFESVRCDPWLRAGQPIVSETSLDSDLRCITVLYEGIVEACRRLKEGLKDS